MMNLLQKYPDDFRVHSSLGIALAGLGEKENALKEGNKAVAMMPVSKDAIIGLAPLEDLALIHVLNGEQATAMDILEQLLKMPFGWDTTNTIPLLKAHPYWKPLLNNPRFRNPGGERRINRCDFTLIPKRKISGRQLATPHSPTDGYQAGDKDECKKPSATRHIRNLTGQGARGQLQFDTLEISLDCLKRMPRHARIRSRTP